jgi:tetratricopeptide (TPR) repeat protein
MKINKTFIISILLIGMTLLVYCRVVHFEFISLDDSIYVFNNHDLQGTSVPKKIIWALTTIHAAFWHPLTWFSYILDFEFYGLNPGGYHLTNLLFHLASTVLLFFFFEKMTRRLYPSALVAALFALHPLHVESVAWIAERKDVLSAFFWMLTMGAYIRYVEQPIWSRYGLVFLSFLGGLMAKPMVVTLPLVLLLLDYWPLGRLDFFKREERQGRTPSRIRLKPKGIPAIIIEKIPFFLLSLVFAGLSYYAQQNIGALNQSIPLPTRMANSLFSYWSYLAKMVWPLHLSVFYPYPATQSFWQILGVGFILSLVSGLAVWKYKTYPYLIVGWLWYVITLIPVIGLVQVGIHSLADRYTYLPLIGPFIILSWGMADLSAKWPYRKRVLSLSAGVGLLLLMILSWTQVSYWRNSKALFQQAIAATPGNFKAHDLLGFALMEQGQLFQALVQFREAIRINPNYGSAYNNLGVALEKKGDWPGAMVQYRIATGLAGGAAEAHYNLGILLIGQGKLEEAQSHFQAAIRNKKDYGEAYNNWGLILQRQGKTKEAIEAFGQAIQKKPRLVEAYYNLGTVLASVGQLELAEKHLQGALAVQPRYVKALNNLGLIQAAQGKTPQAINSWQRALEIDPRFQDAAQNLHRVLVKKESGK